MKKVVIIGGGVAGLATAALLLREGHQVTIVERGAELGGRAGTLTVPEAPGFRWDTGPSWYLMPDAFEHFFELCGSSVAEHYELETLEPAYRVIDEHGEAIDVHSGVAAVVELFESREPGAGAKVRRYLESSSEVYDLAIEGFLYTNFRNFLPYLAPGVLRRLPQLLASLATSLKVRVNAQFRDAKLRQILSYPAVFLSSDPGAIPALYHLMSHTDLVQGVQYPRGGFATVINALTTLADGAVIHLDSEVEEITVRDRKVTGVRVGERHIPADIVVSCADLHHTETRLLPEELRSRSEASWGRGEPGLGAVLVLAGVRGELPELLHHTLLFSSDWDDDFRKVFEGLPGGCRPRSRSTSPGPPPRTRMRHRRATRTSSSWFRSRLTPASDTATPMVRPMAWSGRSRMPRSRRSRAGPGSGTSPSGSSSSVRWAPATSTPATTPGTVGRSAPPTPWASPPSSGGGMSRTRSGGCSTPGPPPCRASGCRCA